MLYMIGFISVKNKSKAIKTVHVTPSSFPGTYMIYKTLLAANCIFSNEKFMILSIPFVGGTT